MNALYTAAVLGVALSLGYLVRWIWGLVKRRRRKMEITIGEVDMPYSAKGESVSVYTDPNTVLEVQGGSRMKLEALQLKQQDLVQKTMLKGAKAGLGFFGQQAMAHIDKGDPKVLLDSLNMHPALYEHLQAGRETVKKQLAEWLTDVAQKLATQQHLLEEEKHLTREGQRQLAILECQMVGLKDKLTVQQRFLAKIGGIVEMQTNLLPMDLEDNGKPLGAPTRFQLGPFETREVLCLYWDLVADEVDAKIGKEKPQLTDADMESAPKPIEWPQKMSLTIKPPVTIDFSKTKGGWNAAAR